MIETDFKYDVFVSYSSANKDWVRKTFVPLLESAGLKVCDYYRDFDVGAPIVMEMERAILESRKTIPVLSPAYLKSGWTEFESLMLQTLDAANRERRLLPVILETCELPLRIKYMNCINFANPDDIEIEWQRLSRALGLTLSPSIIDTKSPDTGSRDTWHLAHPYPMPPNFTGRAAEQKMLDDWLADEKDRLFILRALGGFGKSALAWQWINTHVNPTEWTRLVWWSFYEGDASFEHFVEETLKYLKLEFPQGPRPQVDELLKAMQGQKILLIMDGFERALRAYSSMDAAYQGDEEPKLEDNQLDCVNINAEILLKSVCSLPNMKSKILMTTRLTPRAMKPSGEFMLGCREEELTAMQKEDAVEFFHKQGIQGNRAEIEAACAAYGYHPLSLRILAGLIVNNRENPSDIEVSENLDITDDIIQNKHHVLKVAYEDLSLGQQKLLGNIACFRSPMSYQILRFITSKPSWKRGKNKTRLNENLDNSLQILESRGLLYWDRKVNKYDLHPIVRRYAYELLTASDRITAHRRLRDYFATIDMPAKPRTIDELSPAIELYHHTVRAGEFGKAFQLLTSKLVPNPLHFQFGAYHLIIELERALFADHEYRIPKLNNEAEHAWLYNSLANSYSMSGQPHRAVPLFEQQINFREKNNKENISLALGLGNIAFMAQIYIGNLRSAESNLQRSIRLCKELGDDRYEATMSIELGRLLTYWGEWDKSGKELEAAEKISDKYGAEQTNFGSGVYAYRTLRALLMIRDPSQSKIDNQKLAIEFIHRALILAEEHAKLYRPVERDFVQAHWLLGAAYRLDGQLTLAEHHLTEALTRDRSINLVESEANILLDIARLRYDQKNYEEAKSLAEEALTITERCDYVLQGADVNLFLAQYALEQEQDKAKAKEYAESALKLARCDGPPYYYKVAYEEAERMLAGL